MSFLKMSINRSKSAQPVVWLFAGVLLGIGHVVSQLFFLSVFGVALFLWAIISTLSGPRRFLGGMLVGTTTALLALFWYFSVYPVPWLPEGRAWLQLGVIGVCWLISAVALSFGSGALAYFFGMLYRRNARWLGLFPVLWVVAEVLNSFAFSIVTIGRDIVPNVHFSFGYLGYTLAESAAFFPLASFGGVYALSLVGAVIGATLYYFWQNVARRALIIGMYLGVLLTGWFLPVVAFVPSQGITIAVIETSFDEAFLRQEGGAERKHALLNEAIDQALTTSAGYILLPEDSRFVPGDITPAQVYPWFRFGRASTSAVVLDSGTIRTVGGAQVLRGVIIDPKTQSTHLLDKQYLVPQGEFVPYASRGLFRLFGLRAFIEKMHSARAFVPGEYRSVDKWTEDLPGIIFCFESVSPLGVRQALASRSAPFIAHPISHGWFNTPTLLWRQLDTMLRVQARWNNIAIVSAGNQSLSLLYTGEGLVITPPVVATGERYTVRLIEL